MKMGSRARKRIRDEAYRRFRDAMIVEVGRCEMAPLDPTHRTRMPLSTLQIHHIMRGTRRERSLTERCAILVLCCECHCKLHTGRKHWPEASQLALLKLVRPLEYSLEEYNRLFAGPANRITEADVDKWANR
uniref:HNH endonuclease n=1 Tax=viral metagenome TaxID=1070528 RepID=A0A6M3JJF9_9ZZZZ